MHMTPLTRWVEDLDQINNILQASKNNNKQETTCSKWKKKEELEEIKKNILNGKLLNVVADSEATSSCVQVGDLFIATGKPSTKTFHTLFRQVAWTAEAAQLHILVREPAQTVDIVLELKHNSLLSISKFAEANCVTVFTSKDMHQWHLISEGRRTQKQDCGRYQSCLNKTQQIIPHNKRQHHWWITTTTKWWTMCMCYQH